MTTKKKVTKFPEGGKPKEPQTPQDKITQRILLLKEMQTNTQKELAQAQQFAAQKQNQLHQLAGAIGELEAMVKEIDSNTKGS